MARHKAVDEEAGTTKAEVGNYMGNEKAETENRT